MYFPFCFTLYLKKTRNSSKISLMLSVVCSIYFIYFIHFSLRPAPGEVLTLMQQAAWHVTSRDQPRPRVCVTACRVLVTFVPCCRYPCLCLEGALGHRDNNTGIIFYPLLCKDKVKVITMIRSTYVGRANQRGQQLTDGWHYLLNVSDVIWIGLNILLFDTA